MEIVSRGMYHVLLEVSTANQYVTFYAINGSRLLAFFNGKWMIWCCPLSPPPSMCMVFTPGISQQA